MTRPLIFALPGNESMAERLRDALDYANAHPDIVAWQEDP